MLADAGATAVIVGPFGEPHRPQRKQCRCEGESEAAWRQGLTAIVCVGEQRAEREAGKTLTCWAVSSRARCRNGSTAANLVVAYEPVWAIGTGLTPTAADVAEVHAFIRKTLTGRFGAAGAGVRILYGGR